MPFYLVFEDFSKHSSLASVYLVPLYFLQFLFSFPFHIENALEH